MCINAQNANPVCMHVRLGGGGEEGKGREREPIQVLIECVMLSGGKGNRRLREKRGGRGKKRG